MAGLFIKLDTNFWSHPRILAAGEQAAVLYQQMAMYCMDHATDGHVPTGQLPRFGLPRLRHRLDALVAAGLVKQADGGWVLPGYVERYKSSAEVAELRRVRAEAGRKGGRPRKQVAKATGNQIGFTASNPEEEEEEEIDSSTSSHGSAARPPTPDDDDPDDDDLAAELLRSAGYPRSRPTPGEQATVATLGRRGWTDDQLRGMALRASQATVDPRAYLAKMLAEALNSDPADTRHHVDQRRPLLDDERPPCSTCHATRWVDQDDGTVAPCPTCTQIGAPAPP